MCVCVCARALTCSKGMHPFGKIYFSLIRSLHDEVIVLNLTGYYLLLLPLEQLEKKTFETGILFLLQLNSFGIMDYFIILESVPLNLLESRSRPFVLSFIPLCGQCLHPSPFKLLRVS